MQFNKTVKGDYGFVVLVFFIVGVGGHQLGLGCPDGIGVLTLDPVKEPGGFCIVASTQLGGRPVVENFNRRFVNKLWLIVGGAGIYSQQGNRES